MHEFGSLLMPSYAVAWLSALCAAAPPAASGIPHPGAGKQLQHLAENAGYSYHGGGGLPSVHVFSTQTIAESRCCRSNANFDRSAYE